MGITGILRWSNPPLGSPNGLDLIVQRVSEQYGQNVIRKPYQVQVRQHKPTQLLPQITQSDAIQNAIDPSGNQTPTSISPPESLITVMYPRQPRSVEASHTVFVQQTRHQKHHPSNASPGSTILPPNNSDVAQVKVVGQRPDEMLRMRPEKLVPWLQEQGAKGNKYLVYPRAIVDSGGKNIANMTASLLAPTKKVRAVDPYAPATITNANNTLATSASRSAPDPIPTPTLSGGALVSIDGIQLDISLGGVGMNTGSEWVVRVGWVAGMGGEDGRGLVVEAEYLPLDIYPQPPASPDALSQATSLPLILQEFLLSLLPEPHPLAIPPVYKIPLIPGDDAWGDSDESNDGRVARSRQNVADAPDVSPREMTEAQQVRTWNGLERMRRVAWLLVEGLKEDGVLS